MLRRPRFVKRVNTIYCAPLLGQSQYQVLDTGIGIRDQGSGIRDQGLVGSQECVLENDAWNRGGPTNP